MKFRGHDLYMVRGDTETFTVKLIEETSSGKTQKKFVSDDSIKMTIGEYTDSETTRPTIKKTIAGSIDATTGTATIKILPTTTSDLKFGPCQYLYDIQVTFADGTIKTLFPAAQFVLCMEVST